MFTDSGFGGSGGGYGGGQQRGGGGFGGYGGGDSMEIEVQNRFVGRIIGILF